jgi:hypothetical protein
MTRRDRSSPLWTLKGPDTKAQGNALGTRGPIPDRALKGRHNRGRARPFPCAAPSGRVARVGLLLLRCFGPFGAWSCRASRPVAATRAAGLPPRGRMGWSRPRSGMAERRTSSAANGSHAEPRTARSGPESRLIGDRRAETPRVPREACRAASMSERSDGSRRCSTAPSRSRLREAGASL